MNHFARCTEPDCGFSPEYSTAALAHLVGFAHEHVRQHRTEILPGGVVPDLAVVFKPEQPGTEGKNS